ncbi:hypothetical protein ACHQM5_021702 [Ranunculus cassubicifolius]
MGDAIDTTVADGDDAEIIIIKLNGDNYHQWENFIRVSLTANRKLKFITDEPLPETDEKYEDWQVENSIVMTWLWNRMEPSISLKVMEMTTAKAIWIAVKEMYGQVRKSSRVYHVFEKMFNLKKGDMSVVEYYSLLKNTWEELQVYHPLTSDLETVKKQHDEFQTALFLCGLGPEYASIKDKILASEKLPSLAVVYSRVLHATASLCTTGSESLSLVYSSRLGSSHGGTEVSHGGRGSETMWCTYCGNIGHTVAFCWSRVGNFASHNQAAKNRQFLLNCAYCGISGHTEDFCWYKLGKSFRGVGSKCTYCGNSGHSENVCWDKWGKPAAGGLGFDVKCSYCGVSGHAELSCWHKWGKPGEIHPGVGTIQPPVPNNTSHSVIDTQSSSYLTRDEFTQLSTTLPAMVLSSPSSQASKLASTSNTTSMNAQPSTSRVINSGFSSPNTEPSVDLAGWFEA